MPDANPPTTPKFDRSVALFRAAQEVLPGGVNSPVRAFRGVGGTPVFIDHASGPYLWDVDGNRYIDYVLSWGPLVLGHAAPAVVRAISDQAARGTSYGAPTELETKLAHMISGIMPSIEMLRFVSSGTEATMSALRLARAYTGKSKIVKFMGHYHGHSDMLLVKAGSGVATLGLPDSPGVPSGATESTLNLPFNNRDAVEAIFHAFPNEIAAVILEPVAGNMGLILPQPGYLQFLREITTRYGALLIFDEVMTGFRVSLGGAQQHYGVSPDITALGKVIGGGMPVGAYGGKAEIMNLVAPAGPMYQAGTLSGNPLAMAAGIATLEEWCRPGVFESTAARAQQLVAGFLASAAASDVPLQAASIGTMFGFFFTEQGHLPQNYDEAKTSDTGRFATVFHRMLERGIYLAPSQFEAGFISAAHQDEDVRASVLAFAESL